MISSLITSQTRIRLLKKFFLNSSTRAHLRGLETEFGESSNAIRIELNRLEDAGLLKSHREGNKKVFSANRRHPLFSEIHNIILKETGIDKVVDKVIERLGNLAGVYLTGDFAMGRDSQVIDLVLVGDGIDREYLARKVAQAEALVMRKVRYIILKPEEERGMLDSLSPANILPLWSKPAAPGPGNKSASDNEINSTSASAVKNWYAVYTKARAEKQVLRSLNDAGYEAWLPLQKTLRQWSDRKKMVEKPLFSSYVFVRVTPRDFYGVQGTQGICTLIKCQGRPVPIPQNQIDNLRLIIDSRAEVEVTGEKFEKGDEVMVTMGALKGLRGELISRGDRKMLLVRIDSIEQNITITVPGNYLRRL